MKFSRCRLVFHFFFVCLSCISFLLLVGCGQVATSSMVKATPTPTPAVTNPNNFVYVTVNANSTIEGFKIDPSGQVSPIHGSPFPAPEGPFGIARNQDFLFVGSFGVNVLSADKDLITAFRIDPSTGVLSQVASLHNLFSLDLAVDRAGQFLYAVNTAGVGVFSLGSDGRPSEIPGSPFGSPSSLVFVQGSLIFHPSGKFLYSWGTPDGHGDPGPFAIFASLDPRSGVPSNGQMLGPATSGLDITPDGKFMVAGNAELGMQNQVCTYTIDPSTGAPSSAVLGGQAVTPFNCLNAAGVLDKVAINPTGSLVAVTGADGITMLHLSNGSLSQVAGSPFSLPFFASRTAFSRDGKYLFVTSPGPENPGPLNEVVVFQVNAGTGALMPAPGSPFLLSGPPGRLVQ